MEKNIFITMAIITVLAIPSFSMVNAIDIDSPTTAEDTIQSPQVLDKPETSMDLNALSRFNMKLKKPTGNTTQGAAISENDAIQAASDYFPLSSSAKNIKVEYQLLTADLQIIPENAIRKNDKLKENGLNEAPVYIVIFQGVSFLSAGGAIKDGKTQHEIFRENNIVVDAVSGVVLFSFSYR
ncbi:hypothetical protein RJP21_01840 [Paenibacillus sp. VCA1]|uniref:hypothetical protein n=1 Tax=Paenibacillus sp. VCA1 TaxID=3039148 RepID=UPI0028717524|nr:hypothetical protein [Paenibacillus sp. VCA1]MDR9852339.1 hypothetical protein [Paenibacillus sp. VCA1]